MPNAEADPRRTLVILIGASVFPGDKKLSNPRFASSAKAMREYFVDPARFALPESNLLWLFDTTESPTSVYDRIESFLHDAAARPKPEQPHDVIVYYVGHGFFGDDRAYHLAARSLKKGAPEYSYRFRALQRTVKQEARTLRKFYLIDACFSAAAMKELMGVDSVVEKVIAETKREAADDLPNTGTALLCAAPPDDVALAPASQTFTMFTGALLEVLNGKPTVPRLTLKQLHQFSAALIQDRFQADAVRPQIHSPEQAQGDIATVPLFPGGGRLPTKEAVRVNYRDAFERASFGDDNALYALVVKGPAAQADAKMPLEQEVARAWKEYGPQIAAAANHYREGLRLPPVAARDSDGGFVIVVLPIERAFDSPEQLSLAVNALCRCEVTVFDLTGFDPAVLFLLGIRSVARRGITLSSIGGSHVIGSALAVPFNLQLLNLTAHSKEQLERGEGKRPFDLIGKKIQNGFRELADLPQYLDLPAYDSVRQLGVQSAAYRPIRYTEKALVLCPFGPEYSGNNWRLFLGVDLQVELRQHARRADPPEDVHPRVERLLDVDTPRLVAETLFNAIRLTDLCIIDWTFLRPNVMFEAGIRLATNALGAVHIIEATTMQGSPLPDHVEGLIRLFGPLVYRCETYGIPYDEMFRRFEESIRNYGDGRYGFVFEAVGKSIQLRSQSLALPVVDELLRNANIFSSDDEESAGVSPVLFHEVNRELVVAARDAAAERRLAAWLYLSQRFTAEQVAGDPRLSEQFRLLKSQVRRWARNAGRSDLIASIKAFEQAVAAKVQSGAPR
jgi:Caspase domain